MAQQDDEEFPGELTVGEKAALTSGGDSWHTQALPDRGIPAITMCDGPHGLRKSLDGRTTVPATCFPPAVALASSWDPALAYGVGVAIAEECQGEDVSVILGPAINIKRNPLGGRCFEYWAEDPCATALQASGLVKGLQSRGVGATVKHFAVNSQETDRMRVDARVGERALHEIYLPAFEWVIRTAHPWMVMCSYNRINGVFASQDAWLLTQVLCDEWGFDGLVVSDWGACHDRVAALKAGLDLEMPPSGTDDVVARAVEGGECDQAVLDRAASRVLALVERAQEARKSWIVVHKQDNADSTERRDIWSRAADDAEWGKGGAMFAAHHDLARQAAAESAVLLKNETPKGADSPILPLTGRERIAVVGEFARTPRYQGGGSSHINPTKVTSFLDALAERGIQTPFAPGFTLGDDSAVDAIVLKEEAVRAAKSADVVLMFLGLPESAESEGFDRTTIDLPARQVAVLRAVAAANPNVVVILSNGSVVSLAPWRDSAASILETWLTGQAGGGAVADVLFGDVNPSGRLAQTIPLDIADDPSMAFGRWTGEEGHVDYAEGVFVGYRHYDTNHIPVAYEFGYGLSYSTFELENASAHIVEGGDATHDADFVNHAPGWDRATDRITVRVTATVRNTSDRDGAQVVQLYIAPPKGCAVARPAHELQRFARVEVPAGGARTVVFTLGSRDFSYWSERFGGWKREGGTYTIQIGSSSRRIEASLPVEIPDDGQAAPLDEWSTFSEWEADPLGAKAVATLAARCEAGDFPPLPDDPGMRMFLSTTPVGSLTMVFGRPGAAMGRFLLDEYRCLASRTV